LGVHRGKKQRVVRIPEELVPFLEHVTSGLQPRPVLVVPHERLLTVREAAARLGVCISTVYKLCAQGRLAHVRIANAVRIPPDDLKLDQEASRSGT